MRPFSLIVVAAMVCASSTAWAESADTTSEEYTEQINDGHRQFANNDRDAALRAYRRALREGSDNAMATYYIACVQRAEGDFDAALETFQESARLAGESNPSLKARALMNIAFVQEARRDFPAAREAWRAYISFIESHSDVRSYVPNARERIAAITAWEELDAAYAPVRERIQAREAENSD
jgi:tetratricopeptide (TPR) repeat protein